MKRHQMYPDIHELELVLFKASGWDTSKSQQKTSFHAIWPQIIVDKARAGVVRTATVSEFHRGAKKLSWLSKLTRKLQELNEKNTGMLSSILLQCWLGHFECHILINLQTRSVLRDRMIFKIDPCVQWAFSDFRLTKMAV